MGISDWENNDFQLIFFHKKCSLSMWHLYSWTNMTESTNWSTAGFSVQCPSLLSIKSVMRIMATIHWKILTWCTNKFSELWCLQRKNSGGELTVWTLKMMKDTMSDQINPLLCKAKKNSIQACPTDSQLSVLACYGKVLVYLYSYLVGVQLVLALSHKASENEN